MSKTFQHMLDTLDSLPRNSPIIGQTARILQVLVSLDDNDTREEIVKLAEGVAKGSYIIVKNGGNIT